MNKAKGFTALLHHDVFIDRLKTAGNGNGPTGSPAFDRLAQLHHALIQPLRAQMLQGPAGRYPQATHRAYIHHGLVGAGDRLVRIMERTTLAEEALADAQAIVVEGAGQHATPGARVEIGEGEQVEQRIIQSREGDSLGLNQPTAHGYPSGTPVAVVAHYEVQGVEDEGGQGHHDRLAVREIGV